MIQSLYNTYTVSDHRIFKQGWDWGKYACGVFLDLKKAFGTLNDDILLKKLYYYGIRGVTNNWFRSFLNDRKQFTSMQFTRELKLIQWRMQFTSVNRTQSDKRELKEGVPHESLPGALLFKLFINDLHEVVQFITVHHFADDINMHLVEKSPSKND